MIAQHSSKSNEHFSPPEVVEAARALMGGIDLDPASCEEANRVVKAERFFDKTYNGLWHPREWSGRVFLNPPGGKLLRNPGGLWEEMPRNPATGRQDGPGESSALIWWETLVQAWREGAIAEAVFVGFSIEMLRHTQRLACSRMQLFPRVVPRDRLRFSGANSPTNANVLVYLPPTTVKGGELADFGHFKKHFGQFGCCEPGFES